jgi:hypothetical protein
MKNGVVVMDQPDAIPDGIEVSIRPLKARATRRDRKPKTVFERYRRSIGIMKDMPADLSINHDHYLYGTPKRK